MNTKTLKLTLKALAACCLLASLSACVAAGSGWYTDYSVSIAPPPIPEYAQPPCPGAGYIWQPGYWAWGNDGYYWDSGEWVLPPQPGLLWTPGYWDFDGDSYVWIAGHWGATVGYYGDIDYGYGYFGDGFDGGYWDGDRFFYNAAVLNIGPDFDGYIYHRGPEFAEDRIHFWGHPDWHDGEGEDHRGDFGDFHRRDPRGDFGHFDHPDQGGFDRFHHPRPDGVDHRPVFQIGLGANRGNEYHPRGFSDQQHRFVQPERRAPRVMYRPQFRPQFRPQPRPVYHPQYRPAPHFSRPPVQREGRFQHPPMHRR